MVQPTPKNRVIAEPSSPTAMAAKACLDERIELGEIDTELSKLGMVLSEKLNVEVFLNQRAVELAELKPETKVSAKLREMPVRSAMRFLLSPLGLRVIVEEEGLVITADFEQLTRRGIATDLWIGRDNELRKKIADQLWQGLKVDFKDTPLNEAVAEIAKSTNLTIVVDTRALEEIGLTPDTPVSFTANNVSLKNLFRLMLRDLDLTTATRDGAIQISTFEACEKNLVNRVYFLEGIGMAKGEGEVFDFDSLIQLVQTTVAPDTWETLGGPSTMSPGGIGNRPSVLVSTTDDVHAEIEALLKGLRSSLVDRDATVIVRDLKSPRLGGDGDSK